LETIASTFESQGYYDRGYGLVQAAKGDLEEAFLMYLSEHYFKGPNAYGDWLENRENQP
jgi:hypothetical protein